MICFNLQALIEESKPLKSARIARCIEYKRTRVADDAYHRRLLAPIGAVLDRENWWGGEPTRHLSRVHRAYRSALRLGLQ
ncbi:hypothetical protein BHM03_00023734 [Ensete ventricosum]|nr:hypothetical protein BHM03_00023734 [Ensete ventricosum]